MITAGTIAAATLAAKGLWMFGEWASDRVRKRRAARAAAKAKR